MGKKSKKSSFEEYTIVGEASASAMFPLPQNKEAVRPHKKFFDKGGVVADKAPPGYLRSSFPGLRTTYPGLRIRHLDPLVLTIEDFFTAAECDAYKVLRDDAEASFKLEQSATFSSMTAAARTSTTWFVRYQEASVLLAKASALLGRPIHHFEEPQLVWYQSGQSFSWHYDAVPPTLTANGGQRLATLLVYLEDVPSGGCTVFRDLKAGGTNAEGRPRRLQVHPKKGRALLFFPSDADGEPDERTLHAGEPTEHEKWVAQLWLHQRPYEPKTPPSSSHEAAAERVAAYAQQHGIELPTNYNERK